MASNPSCKGETEAVIDFPLHTDHRLGLESSLSGACGLEAHLKPHTHTHTLSCNSTAKNPCHVL